jgi:hypothetical protein
MIPTLKRLPSRWRLPKIPVPRSEENNRRGSIPTPDRTFPSEPGAGTTNGRVYPQSIGQLSIPSEMDEHSQKRAGDSFELDELFDLNGENFWSGYDC